MKERATRHTLRRSVQQAIPKVESQGWAVGWQMIDVIHEAVEIARTLPEAPREAQAAAVTPDTPRRLKRPARARPKTR